MITGGYSDKLFKSLLIFVILILPGITFSTNLDVVPFSDQPNGMVSEKAIIDDGNSIHLADNSPIALEFDTQISFQLDSTTHERAYRINVAEPGILLINWSFQVISAGVTGPDFWFIMNESAVLFVPQLDQYVDDQVIHNPIDGWHELTTGFSSQQEEEIFAVNSGFVDLNFEMDWKSSTDNITVTLEASWIHSFGSPPQVSAGQNFSLEWVTDSTWDSVILDIPEDGLYEFAVDSYLPYETSTGYVGPLNIEAPERLLVLSCEYGSWGSSGAPTYWEYYPNHFISVGSTGVSNWSDEDLVPLRKGNYFVLGLSGLFTHLNGTKLNVTFDVEQLSAIQLDSNEHSQLNFDITEPATSYYIAVPLSEGSLSTIRFANPTGGNWSVSTLYYPSMMSAIPSLTYMEYPSGESIIEDRFSDIFVFSTYGVFMGPTPRNTLLTGNPASSIYQPYGFLASYEDGEQTDYALSYLPLSLPFPILFFEVSANPAAASYSDTFSVTIYHDVEPFQELDEGGATASFNETTGQIIEFYRFSVKSGYTYNITATPIEYTSMGAVAFALYPCLSLFNQWTIAEYPMLAKVTSDYPPYSIIQAQTVNRTASVEFIAAVDGEVYVYGAGAGLSLGDCTEIEFKVQEISPTPLDFGETIPLQTDEMDIYDFEVELVEGYDYQFTVRPDPSRGSVYATFLDEAGVNPFALTIDDIWIEVDSSEYLYKTTTLNSHYTGIAHLGLIIEGEVTIEWDVIDTTPPDVNIISPFEGSKHTPGTVLIEFSAYDEIELGQLNISIGGSSDELNLTDTSYQWDAESQGVYVIALIAQDTHGNIASSVVVVIIEVETYFNLESLVLSGIGTFGLVMVVGIVIIRRRGGS